MSTIDKEDIIKGQNYCFRRFCRANRIDASILPKEVDFIQKLMLSNGITISTWGMKDFQRAHPERTFTLKIRVRSPHYIHDVWHILRRHYTTDLVEASAPLPLVQATPAVEPVAIEREQCSNLGMTKKWEYQFITNFSVEKLHEPMKEFGREGYELVSVVTQDTIIEQKPVTMFHAFMKREV